jgi:glycosyltransferase involved in cell wall biosynthesis
VNAAVRRIAVITTSYPREPGDAAGHFVAAEVEELARAGHRVTVLTGGPFALTRTAEPGQATIVELEDGGASGWPGLLARIREQPSRAVGLARWAFRVRRALAEFGPFDQVIAHFLVPTGWVLVMNAPLGGARIEVVVHGSDARLVERLPRWFARRFLSALLRRGARFRCVSQELATLLDELAGKRLGSAVCVQASPIDTRGVPARAAARAHLGVPKGSRLIVLIGRLIAEKRMAVALRAAECVQGVHVAVIGSGPEQERLARAFPRAQFLGRLPRPQTLEWIRAADVVLSASRREGAPTVVREARALGTPVVATAAGDLGQLAEADPGLWVVA